MYKGREENGVPVAQSQVLTHQNNRGYANARTISLSLSIVIMIFLPMICMCVMKYSILWHKLLRVLIYHFSGDGHSHSIQQVSFYKVAKISKMS